MTTDRRPGTALVVGATGISGQTSCRELIREGWTTYGLSRRPALPVPDAIPVQADLLDVASLREALREITPEIVLITAWQRQPTEQKNIEVNSAIVHNVLDAVEPAGTVRHVALMTG